jgi:cold shock CspA family protein
MPQGTIKEFDVETKSGCLLLDNQEELPIDAETFAASGMLELRLGQRVSFEIDGSGDERRVREIRIVGMF